MQKQPEFHEQIWQYVNRRVSDWRIINGRDALRRTRRVRTDRTGISASSAARCWPCGASNPPMAIRWCSRTICVRVSIARSAGLERTTPSRLLETELINALKIVDRGWGTPEECADPGPARLGHTQWMPEVWLNVGMDYDRMAGSRRSASPTTRWAPVARYLVNRGKYHRSEHWGYEVRAPSAAASGSRIMRPGPAPVFRAPTASRLRSRMRARKCGCRSPAGLRSCSTEFLCGAQLQSVDELCARNLPSRRSHSRRTDVHPALPRLGARADAGRGAEMQTRLTKAGFDTGGMTAVSATTP